MQFGGTDEGVSSTDDNLRVTPKPAAVDGARLRIVAGLKLKLLLKFLLYYGDFATDLLLALKLLDEGHTELAAGVVTVSALARFYVCAAAYCLLYCVCLCGGAG